MAADSVAFASLLKNVVDNRGRTCPTASTGIPLIATNCVKNELLYPSYENVRFVDEHTYATWFRGHPQPGDFLFVTKGSPGRIAMVPNPVDFCIAQDMVAIRADEEKVYPPYLFALLRSREVQEKIEQLHVGTMIPHFKKGDFDKLLLPILDRQIQEFIGDCYFAFSSKIDLNRKMNQTLEAMARALFKSWFVDFDPVRAKAEGRNTGLPEPIAALFPDSFGDSQLGEIPMGWSTGSLADFALLNPENWVKNTRPKSIRYVDLGNTKWGRIESITRFAEGAAPSRAQRILRDGDTIIGTVRPGNGAYALVTEDGLTGSTGFAVLRPKKPIYQEYIYTAATAADNIETLAHLADGGAYPAVRPDIVFGKQLVRPPDDVVSYFSNVAGDLLAKVELNQRESRTLAALRDGLLPQLISGELRLPTFSHILGEHA